MERAELAQALIKLQPQNPHRRIETGLDLRVADVATACQRLFSGNKYVMQNLAL